MRSIFQWLLLTIVSSLLVASTTLAYSNTTPLESASEQNIAHRTRRASNVSTGSLPGSIETKNVEFLGHVGGITEAIFVQEGIAYIGEGPRLTLVNVAVPGSPRLLGKTEPMTGIVRDILVIGDIAYVVTAKAGNLWGHTDSSTADKGGLYLIDVSTPTAPVILSFTKIPGWHIESVVVQGSFAYISGDKNIHVVDISDPLLPHDMGDIPYGGSIIVENNIAYVASSTFFFILDISNLAQIITLGELANVLQLDSMTKKGDLIFAAHYSGINNGITVIDVSNINHPFILTKLDLVFTSLPLRLAIRNETLFVVEQQVSAAPVQLQVFDISNSNIITETSTITDLPEGIASGIGRVDIFVDDNKAYISESNGGLQILDVSDPNHPTVQGSYDFVLGHFNDFSVKNNAFYAAEFNGLSTGRGIKTVDLSDPVNGKPLSFYPMPRITQVFIKDNTVYAIDDGQLHILDASNPAVLSELSTYSISEPFQNIFVSGNTAYANLFRCSVCTESLGFIDISNSDVPQLLNIFEVTFSSRGFSVIAVENQIAYLLDYYYVHLIDVSDVNNPIYLSTYSAGEYASVQIHGNRMYIVSNLGMQVVDVTSPSTPIKVGSLSIAPAPIDIVVEGSIAYVAVADGRVLVIDVSDPHNMTEIGFFGGVEGGFYAGSGYHLNLAAENGLIYLADSVGGLFIIRYTVPNIMTYNRLVP